jgi:hypothetical protein
MSEPELKQELALALFRQERWTLAQPSRFAEASQLGASPPRCSILYRPELYSEVLVELGEG